jgi:hypothetical protein
LRQDSETQERTQRTTLIASSSQTRGRGTVSARKVASSHITVWRRNVIVAEPVIVGPDHNL